MSRIAAVPLTCAPTGAPRAAPSPGGSGVRGRPRSAPRGAPASVRRSSSPRWYARSARRSSRAGHRLDRVAHRVDRAAGEPRDVHLRDPDGLGDLALGEALVVAQADDLAFARAEAVEPPSQQHAMLGELVALVVAADRLQGAGAFRGRLAGRNNPG